MMSDPVVPLERLLALERQFFPMLPDTQPGRDIRAVVLEAIASRRRAATETCYCPDCGTLHAVAGALNSELG